MKSIHEELERINNFKQHKRRVTALKEHNETISIRTLLYGNFNTRIDLRMPEGAPPYEPNEEGVHDEKKYNMSPMVNFQTHQWKREKYFIDLLQSVPPKDAEVIVAHKDKKITEMFPNITKELIDEVWPGFIK